MGRIGTLFILKRLLLIHLNRLSLSALISSQFSLHYFCHFSAYFYHVYLCTQNRLARVFITTLVYEVPLKGHSWNAEIAFHHLKLLKVDHRVRNELALERICTNMRTGGAFSQLIPVHLPFSHTVLLTASPMFRIAQTFPLLRIDINSSLHVWNTKCARPQTNASTF